MKKVAMIGVGKLGQDCAEVMSDAGHDVVGYDVVERNPAFPMRSTIEEAVQDRDLIFIAAPTPHDPIYGGETPTSHLPNKDFDYTIVTEILNEVNKHVTKSQLVVLISTVLPGTVRNILEPCITNARFIYNPYLIAMGTVKWDMVNPEMVIIGTDDGSITGDASELIDFYKGFMQNNPRYEIGTWDEAESIKIFYNTFISTKLALVNMIQDVAEKNGNINVDVVTNALKHSTYRIMGPAYMTAGLGDAGACHPRDNIALRYLADRLDLGYDLFDSIMTAREKQAELMALKCLKNGSNVTIIGKAYKPAVPYLNGSASMLVGYYIEKHGGNVHYYDPNTGDNDLRRSWTHVYLIGYWEQWVEEIKFDNEVVVIDPWRKLTDKQHTGEIIHYGDTRKKQTRYVTPSESIDVMHHQLYQIWPKLQEYASQTHLIYAGIETSTAFIKRPTEDIIEEIYHAFRFEGKKKFLFWTVEEGFLSHIVNKIQRIADILKREIDPSNLFYLTSSVDGVEAYNREKLTHEWYHPINVLACHGLEFKTAKMAIRDFDSLPEYDPETKKNKLFVCFNKVDREHRIRLLERMFSNGLFEKGYYSFEGSEGMIDRIEGMNPEEFPNIIANKDKFPIRLNINENRVNPVDIISDDIKYHRDSHFSIVTETIFYKDYHTISYNPGQYADSMFITEKTFRCMILEHPFIIMARPGILKELRRSGYQTFHPHIDESYDEIEDDKLRFEAIAKEIEILCGFTDEEWIEWERNILAIVKHNSQHIKTRDFSPTDITPFFSDLPKDGKSKPIYLSQEKPDYMTLMKTNVDRDWSPQTIELSGKIKLTFPTHLDGGGREMKDDLITAICATGKSHYNRALEWCAGFGVLGYEILGLNLTKQLVFSDYYDVAIKNVLDTANINGLSDKVTGYVTPCIGNIPEHEKWDLVVSNPPHSEEASGFFEHMRNDPERKHEFIENGARLVVDENWGIHKEFYANIRKHLTDDADLYIIESVIDTRYEDLIEPAGLYIVGKYPISFLPKGAIYHLKVKQ